jgi:hypothetical protein
MNIAPSGGMFDNVSSYDVSSFSPYQPAPMNLEELKPHDSPSGPHQRGTRSREHCSPNHPRPADRIGFAVDLRKRIAPRSGIDRAERSNTYSSAFQKPF